MTDPNAPILFTGFEPSGDDHAAAVIAELKRREPDRPIFAWGGPKMEAAGAEIVERTGDDAVMGLPGLSKIMEHQRINRRIGAWMSAHRPALHVPVDSPAANFPVCKMAKARGAKVVHLVAPQVWAWGRWRVPKLRRLTDHVCCLLPFEEPWFRQRRVPATFVGHPLFDHPLDLGALDALADGWPTGPGPRIALMPGSRPAEMSKNFGLLVGAFNRLLVDHPGAMGIVAATRGELEPTLRRLASESEEPWPEELMFVATQTDAAIRWADLALVVSGTVTLQIARQARPMVVVYAWSRVMYHLIGRWVVNTPQFSLPNLIAGQRVVPELIPHFAGPGPVAAEADRLLTDRSLIAKQLESLDAICTRFHGRHAARGCADVIQQVLEGGSVQGPADHSRTGTSAAAATV